MMPLPKFAHACGPAMPETSVCLAYAREIRPTQSLRAVTPTNHHKSLTTSAQLTADHWPLTTSAKLTTDNRQLTTSAADFARTRFHLTLDDHQTQILSADHHRLILNCTRQWGKSTITAAKAVHHAFTRPGSLTLIVSPGERQSREFLRKAKEFVRELHIKPRSDGDNAMSVQFPNGSRIVGLPGKQAHVRGFSAVSLLIIDEAAWVTEQQYEAVQPMLATTDGDIWMLSTPWGKRGFFWEEWTKGGPEWFKISVKATACPRIKESFLEAQRARMPEAAFRREYLCEFMETGNSVFRREDLEAAVTGEIRSLWG